MGRQDNSKSAAILGSVAGTVGSGGGGGGGGGTAGVSTWNARSGNVYPQNGDYRADQIRTSDASKNVQQKIDEIEAGAVIDDALSPTSTRAVENRAIDAGIRAVDAKTMPAGGAGGDFLVKKTGNDYDTEWVNGSNIMLKSAYDTNNNGKVDKADAAWAMQSSGTYVARLKTISGDTYVLTDLDKGIPNGLCPLDTNKKIPLTHLPDAITSGMTYGGIFNPQTRIVRLTPQAKEILGVTADTMTLQDSSVVPEGYPANVGLFYITTASGTFASMNFTEGDWLMSLGTQWTQVSLAVRVSSVNSKTGAVTLDSDEIPEGSTNLYLTAALKSKLEDIENEATKDTNVIQSAQIITDPDSGQETLRLTNKNGTVVNFAGGGGDLSDYLKKDGNASDTTVRYTPTGSRQAFVGNERMDVIMAKIVTWLNSIEDVAFTGAYNDLNGRPTKVSQFTNDSGYVTRTVNNLSNYYTTAQTYTRDEIEALIDAVGSFNFIEVPSLPTTGIDDHAIYYVQRTGGGYDRYQHMNGQWLYLGSTDVSMEGYVTTNGSSSNTTVTFTTAAERISIASGETLAVIMGKLAKYIADMKTVCFTASWHDLDDGNELATQDDLDEKVDKQQEIAQAGKVLGIGDDGIVTPMTVATGVVRPGTGLNAGIANDTDESPINTATGRRAFAFGDHTKASGPEQFVDGRYNVEDNAGTYAEITGGGEAGVPTNIRTLDWSGRGWYKNGVSVGNTSSNIFTPTVGNDLTTKTYVDGTIDTKIAEANLLKSMVVTTLPDVDVADPNILYLIEDPTHAETYLTYKKVLESQDPDVWVMAAIGSTQVSASDVQVTELPTPSIAFNNAVYQYIGTSTAYKFGFFYTCKNQSYYCWLQTATGNKFFTKSATPRQYDRIYSEIGETLVWWVESVSGVTLTDSAGNTYTRLTTDDKTQYEWQAVNDKTSDFENNGNGTGNPSDRFITLEETESRYKITGGASTITSSNLTASRALTSNSSGKVAASTTTSTELGYVHGVTSAIQTQLNEMWKKIYPVGAIYISYTSTSPATLFGGTWTQISGRFLVASGSASYNYTNTSGSSATGTVNFNATNTGGSPRVQLTTDYMPKHSHGLPYRKCGSTTGTDWRTDPGSVDGYGGSTQTAGGGSYPTGNGAPFNNLPPYLVVYMWRRTA